MIDSSVAGMVCEVLEYFDLQCLKATLFCAGALALDSITSRCSEREPALEQESREQSN